MSQCYSLPRSEITMINEIIMEATSGVTRSPSMLTDLLSDMNVAELDNLIDTIASIDNLSYSQSQPRWPSASDNGDSAWRPFSRSFSTPGGSPSGPVRPNVSCFHIDSTLHVDQHANNSSAPQQSLSTYQKLDTQNLGTASKFHGGAPQQHQHHLNHFQLPSPATTSAHHHHQQRQQQYNGVPASPTTTTSANQQQQYLKLSGISTSSPQQLGIPTPPSSAANFNTSPPMVFALSTSEPSAWSSGAGQPWSQPSSPMYTATQEHRALRHSTGNSSLHTSPALSGRSPLAVDTMHQAATTAQPLRMSQSECLLATTVTTAARPPPLGSHSSAPPASYLTQGPSAPMSIDEYDSSSTLFSSIGYSLLPHPQHQSAFAYGYPGTGAAAAPTSPAGRLSTGSFHTQEANTTPRSAVSSRRPSLPAMTLGLPRRSRAMSSPVAATSPVLCSTNGKPGLAHESSPHMALGPALAEPTTRSPNPAGPAAEPRLCADCSCSATVQWRRRKRVTVTVPQPGTDNHIEIQLGATHNDDALEGTVRQLSNVYGGPLDLSQATFTSKAVMLCNACGLKDMYHSNRTKLLLLANN